MLFIKGSFEAPRCKFTRRLVERLAPFQLRKVQTFDIFSDEKIRQWIKFYSNWPTIPQIYIKGEFIGGADIIHEMIDNDEFDEIVPQECKKLPPSDELAEILKLNEVVAFIGDPSQA